MMRFSVFFYTEVFVFPLSEGRQKNANEARVVLRQEQEKISFRSRNKVFVFPLSEGGLKIMVAHGMASPERREGRKRVAACWKGCTVGRSFVQISHLNCQIRSQVSERAT